MLSSYLFVVLLSAVILTAESRNTAAKARLLGNSYTSTKLETRYITSIIPSSCVHLASTLPPCRNVRYLEFPQVGGFPFFYQPENQISNVVKSAPPAGPTIHATPLGWGEYLGFYAPTVTATATEIKVVTVQDPKTVVTFAIKGCRPLRLPADLDRCPPEPNPFIDELAHLQQLALAPTATEDFMETTSMINPEPPLKFPHMTGTIMRVLGAGSHVGDVESSPWRPESSQLEKLLNYNKPTPELTSDDKLRKPL